MNSFQNVLKKTNSSMSRVDCQPKFWGILGIIIEDIFDG